MLLIVQILLTVVSWKRGWKALALLPLGIDVVLALFIGIIGNAYQVDLEAINNMVFIFDIAATIALGIMVGVKRQVAVNVSSDGKTAELLVNRPEYQQSL